jgi:hypothetical protein
MRTKREPIAIEASQYALATAVFMVTGGLVVVAAAIARGLPWGSAIHRFLWAGLWFATLWGVLMLLFAGGFWIWRRMRSREKRKTPELPAEIRIGGSRDAWIVVVRSQIVSVAFLTFIALVQPRLAAALAGFSVIGVGLLPFWIYQRSRASAHPAYIVRGPGRRQRQWYVKRAAT